MHCGSIIPPLRRPDQIHVNHPNYDALIECLPSQGAPRHAPILSGEYRDLKYAKTGLTRAGVEVDDRARLRADP
jgi:hypothetical protein